jgi:hypothetical protein
MNPAAYMARIAEKSMSLGAAVASSKPSASYLSGGSFALEANCFGGRRWHYGRRRGMPAMMIYQLTDRLHDGRIARVPGGEIAATVSAWLAELGTQSPLVDDLAGAVRGGDWPAAYAIGEHLSVDVAVCA